MSEFWKVCPPTVSVSGTCSRGAVPCSTPAAVFTRLEVDTTLAASVSSPKTACIVEWNLAILGWAVYVPFATPQMLSGVSPVPSPIKFADESPSAAYTTRNAIDAIGLCGMYEAALNSHTGCPVKFRVSTRIMSVLLSRV